MSSDNTLHGLPDATERLQTMLDRRGEVHIAAGEYLLTDTLRVSSDTSVVAEPGAVFEAFGPDLLIWGSDWPHALRASEFTRWLETADLLTAGFTEAERKNIFHDNAARFYRL